jgi:hypothetical protein
MTLTMKHLINMVKTAKEEDAIYIGIKIKMDGFAKDEVIINEKENFDAKLGYYMSTYDDNLNHKFAQGISISGFTYGDDFDSIEGDLIWDDYEDEDSE